MNLNRADRIHRERVEQMGLTPADVVRRCREHVKRLCAVQGITIQTIDDVTEGEAYRTKRLVRAPEIRTTWTYATVLHEVGHIMRPCEPSHRRAEGTCPACEIAAWRWAQANSCIPWTDEMQSNLRSSLGTYLRYADAPTQWRMHEVMRTSIATKRAQLRAITGDRS